MPVPYLPVAACRALAPVLAAFAGAAAADVSLLPPIVVTAPATGAVGFDAPQSVDVIDGARIQRGQARVNLSEPLQAVPGVVANNRQNYAQDLQISLRGFGARASFGLRGIRLYVDGVPASMPDGQGQVSHFDLGAARRIEVQRGAFSALHGNAAGGVIAIETEDGPARPTLTAGLDYGSYDTVRTGLKFGGDTGGVNYLLSGSRFETDGYRSHSAARRDLVNVKLRIEPTPRSSLRLLANHLDAPYAQDPLGLDREQVAADPRQAPAAAITFDTRKRYANTTGGAVYEHELGERDRVRLLVYHGTRSVQQILAIPPAAQAASTSAGGVIDLDREFHGLDARWSHRFARAPKPTALTLGIGYEALDERRQGYNNFDGERLGVIGERRRNEDNRVFNVDEYAQLETLLGDAWSLTLGLRRSRVAFASDDYFPANGDHSGSVVYTSTNPSAGVVYHLRPTVNLYASVGRGFETPTFNELAYRLDGEGLNLGLRAARHRQAELGAKLLLGDGDRLHVALFGIDTRDELAVLQNSGGRAVYRNIERTQRRGIELGYEAALRGGFTALLSYTYLDAQFSSAFASCLPRPPCVFPDTNTATVPAGNRLPGVPRQHVYGELEWRGAELASALELRGVGRLYADDFNTEYASGYAVAGWRIEHERSYGRVTLRGFARIDNLFDRRYVGSVIVNEVNGRHYEPAPGRSYLVGITAAYLI